MSTVCFDTDVLSTILRRGGGPAQLARRSGVVPSEEQATTAITVGELLFGARKRGSRRLEEGIERLIGSELRVLSFDEMAARQYADTKVELEAAGRPLGEPDLRIAAICLSRDLLLITGNVRHFERVPGLRVENWLE